MAVYGPVRHQINIIWTSEASVHIIYFWWRTGPYSASLKWSWCLPDVKLTTKNKDLLLWPSVTWKEMFRQDAELEASQLLLNSKIHKAYLYILYFTFLFSLFVFFSAAGQYNIIWTGTGLPRFRFGSVAVPAFVCLFLYKFGISFYVCLSLFPFKLV
jgi:hypothetical protein